MAHSLFSSMMKPIVWSLSTPIFLKKPSSGCETIPKAAAALATSGSEKVGAVFRQISSNALITSDTFVVGVFGAGRLLVMAQPASTRTAGIW